MRKTLGTMTVAAMLGTGVLTAGGLGFASTASASAGATGIAAASSKGCAPTGKHVPKGAARADAGDVDGDGKNDKIWVSDDRKGFRTASGAVFSQAIANAGGPEVGVFAVHLDQDVVALVEDGRSTFVSALANCKLKKTLDPKGEQVRFNLGFSSPYRDLGCIADDDFTELYALTLGHNTKYKKSWSVRQTVLEVSANGSKATDGDSSVKRYATRGPS